MWVAAAILATAFIAFVLHQRSKTKELREVRVAMEKLIEEDKETKKKNSIAKKYSDLV